MYLGLDQSPRRTGYALGGPGMIRPETGLVKMPAYGDEIGRMLACFGDWLSHTIALNNVKQICFESPFTGGLTSPKVVRKLYALAGTIELIAFRYEIECREISPHEWRRRFIGRPLAPRGLGKGKGTAWLKEQAVAACTARGWHVLTHDAADACGILDWALACDFEEYRNRPAPELAA